MNLKSTLKLALVSISFGGILTTSAIAADGEALYSEKFCITCHGEKGKKPILPTYPKLNGQNKEYLALQTKLIRDKVRKGGGTVSMQALVAKLSDEDIEAIATYLSEVE